MRNQRKPESRKEDKHSDRELAAKKRMRPIDRDRERDRGETEKERNTVGKN